MKIVLKYLFATHKNSDWTRSARQRCSVIDVILYTYVCCHPDDPSDYTGRLEP